MTRIENGQQTLAKVDGEAAANVMDSLKDVAPDVGKYILEFAFSDIYNRSGLDLRQREMITITTLLTQGDTADQLKVHLNGSLNVGLTREEIIETFIHCIPYVGFPKVLNAISVAKEVFSEYDEQIKNKSRSN
ncbi:carboxymuconolactone decarboxylase family protein [Lentilactobacillus raoultii]|uniref:Carboxymuconolactone decarboxylase family protein n=1 Tax=Lentilactobacillus raoultii TaxID=1987503 RepID=A0ABW3PL71_9LACO|nr:carboxymuconolactone decarboxylase family protein [Lentilactobacillus raoultii]